MIKTNPESLTALSRECADLMRDFDSTNEDAIDFYRSISDIILAISQLIEKDIMGGIGPLINWESIDESMHSLRSFSPDINLSVLDAILEEKGMI